MAKFDAAQTSAVAAINQVIYAWGDELDRNDGLKLADAGVLTDDCRYFVGGEWREGLAAAAAFYRARHARLKAGDGVPVMRHIISNLRMGFPAADHAEVGFLLVFFAATGEPPFTDYCDPLAVADVRMECRRDAHGDWRIAVFESGQIFRRG